MESLINHSEKRKMSMIRRWKEARDLILTSSEKLILRSMDSPIEYH
jgi:hypothetical protein